MKKRYWILGISILIVAVPVLVILVNRARSRKALEAYKVELRAKGEKLTWEELGFPKVPDGNPSRRLLLAGVRELASAKEDPGQFKMMEIAEPGRARVIWRALDPAHPKSDTEETNGAGWAAITREVHESKDALADLREALQNPAPRLVFDPLLESDRPPFGELRRAAQWLSAATIVALHEHDLSQAAENIHALNQLARMQRDDVLGISQTMRVTFTTLGIAAIWEALPAEGWTEPMLAALQKDREDFDLFRGVDLSIDGARANLENFFTNAHENGVASMDAAGNRNRQQSLGDSLMNLVWNLNPYEDELLGLRLNRSGKEAVKELQHDRSWSEVQREFAPIWAGFDSKTRMTLGQVRFYGSAFAGANYGVRLRTAVRTQTQCNLAVTAIALERYRLRNHRYPNALNELVPDFLKSVLLDHMSGKPLGYHLNADGSFTLYSVGEDGRDDGGDPAGQKNSLLWGGKDYVWPQPLNGSGK